MGEVESSLPPRLIGDEEKSGELYEVNMSF